MKKIEETLVELDAKKSPETLATIEKNRGKTITELKDEWANSPEGQKYLKKEYAE